MKFFQSTSLKRILVFVLPAFLLISFAMLAAEASPVLPGAEAAYGKRGMVASVNPLATAAGLKVLKHGGNAIDATVAVALTLGVVDGDNSGIGGGCFILIRRANGSLVAIDGRETAPGAARRDMFVRNGSADTELTQSGALAGGVPGALAAYEYAGTHYGKKKLKDLILPAARIADDGFILDDGYAFRLKLAAQEMGRFKSSREVFFKNGKPLTKGDILRQADLAATYRSIAGQGSDWFYRGPFARSVEEWMKQNGGIMTAQDFRQFKIERREPIVSSYRGYKVVTFPPPSSGGVHVAQVLNILENFDLKSFDEATRLHVIAEAMKLAFADRAYWLGDPGFVKVPPGLVGNKYGAALSAKLDRDHVIMVDSHRMPPNWQHNAVNKHTTPLSVTRAGGD